jgi:hypothetical protein
MISFKVYSKWDPWERYGYVGLDDKCSHVYFFGELGAIHVSRNAGSYPKREREGGHSPRQEVSKYYELDDGRRIGQPQSSV